MPRYGRFRPSAACRRVVPFGSGCILLGEVVLRVRVPSVVSMEFSEVLGYEGSTMKKLRLPLLLVALAALVLALVPAASAHPIKPLRAAGAAELVLPAPPDVPHWEYTLTGDIEGIARVDVPSASFPGKTEHWDEVMVITSDLGTITIESRGVWNMNKYPFKYRTTGTVTEATGAYAYLIGASAHLHGWTDSIIPPIAGEVSLRLN